MKARKIAESSMFSEVRASTSSQTTASPGSALARRALPRWPRPRSPSRSPRSRSSPPCRRRARAGRRRSRWRPRGRRRRGSRRPRACARRARGRSGCRPRACARAGRARARSGTRDDDPQVDHARKLPSGHVLTDYHVHLRPDETDASPERYFTAENVERYLEAAAEAGIEELGVSEHVHRFTDALEIWDHPFWQRERARRPRRLLRVRAHDAAAARDRDGLRPRARGPDRRRCSTRTTSTTSSARSTSSATGRSTTTTATSGGTRRRPRPRLAPLLRDARRGGALGPLRHPRPPRPGQDLGRRAPAPASATRAFTTSRRSRRSPRPGSRSRSRPPGCASRSTSSIPSDAFAEMCVDAGAAFALSSDAHVPEDVGRDYERAVEAMRGWGIDEIARVRAPRAPAWSRSDERRVGIGYDSHRFAAGRRLVLGGVEIEHELGLEGHSDADVVTHAVIDALLGRRRARRPRDPLPARRRALARRRLARPAAHGASECWTARSPTSTRP